MSTQTAFTPQPQVTFDLGEPRQNLIEFPVSLAESEQPHRIVDFLGLEHPKRVLAGLIRKPRPCALLFIGPPGSGKTAMGMALADELPGALNHISAQKCDVAALDDLADTCAYYPPKGKFWIPLIDEADQMTEKAQLQLLSRMDGTAGLRPVFGGGFERGETPPIIWVFTCNGRGQNHTVPPASLTPRFLSRCMQVPFAAVSPDELAPYLRFLWKREGGGKVPRGYFKYLATGVGVRDALMRLDVDLLSGPREIVRCEEIVEDAVDIYREAGLKSWETRRAKLA